MTEMSALVQWQHTREAAEQQWGSSQPLRWAELGWSWPGHCRQQTSKAIGRNMPPRRRLIFVRYYYSRQQWWVHGKNVAVGVAMPYTPTAALCCVALSLAAPGSGGGPSPADCLLAVLVQADVYCQAPEVP